MSNRRFQKSARGYQFARYEPAWIDGFVEDLSNATINEVHMPLLIVWPRSIKYLQKIEVLIGNLFGHVPLAVSINLNIHDLFRVTQLVYFGHNFFASDATVMQKSYESMGSKEKRSGVVRLYICPPGTQDKMVQLKDQLREIWGQRYGGVHTTDSRYDSFRVITTLTDGPSLALLLASPLQILRAKLAKIESLAMAVDKKFGMARGSWHLKSTFAHPLSAPLLKLKNDVVLNSNDEQLVASSSSFLQPDQSPRTVSSHSKCRKTIWFGGVKVTSPFHDLLCQSRVNPGTSALWRELERSKVYKIVDYFERSEAEIILNGLPIRITDSLLCDHQKCHILRKKSPKSRHDFFALLRQTFGVLGDCVLATWVVFLRTQSALRNYREHFVGWFPKFSMRLYEGKKKLVAYTKCLRPSAIKDE